MGGNAFRSGSKPLNIVRLRTAQYIKLRDQYQKYAVSHFATNLDLSDIVVSILMKFYGRVVVPPEAPEKGDHGDIDFLTDEPRFNFASQRLELTLGADAHTKNGGTTSFAIWMLEDSNDFFQLDIRPCKKGCLEWDSVIYAYEDLWHIIGSIVTHFGLAINDSGLHARVEEIERANNKASLLLLSNEPREMMGFLGLDELRYERGFSTLDELFEWACLMPLFRKKFFEKQTISKRDGRTREKRPISSRFVTEWLPQKATFHASTAPPATVEQMGSQAEATILTGSSTMAIAHCLGDEPVEDSKAQISPLDDGNDLLNKALMRFNKCEEYQKISEDHRKRALTETMWKEIAKVLPLQGKGLGRVMVTLKANLWRKDGQPRFRSGGR